MHVAVVEVLPSRGCGRACAPAGGGGWAGSPSSQSRDDVVIELLRPEQPGVRLPDDRALVLGRAARRARARRTRRPRRCARANTASNSAPNGRARSRRSRAQPQPQRRADPPAGTVERVVTRRPWSRVPSGLTRACVAVDDAAWNASLVYGLAFGAPNSRSALVSLSVNSSSGAPAARRRRRAEAAERRRARRRIARSPARARSRPLRPVALVRPPPRPGVAEPQRRQHVERRGLRAAVRDGDRGSARRPGAAFAYSTKTSK